jgi:adenylate cyclase
LVEIILGPLGARAVALDMVLPEASGDGGDLRLAALAAHAPLVFAVALDYQPRHPPLAQGQTGSGQPPQANEIQVHATGYIGNHAIFGKPRCIGNIGFVPDVDGSVRRLPASSLLGDIAFRPLAVALQECADQAPSRLSVHPGDEGFWRIPFRRNWSAYTVIPAHLIIGEQVPTELFAGRLVLVGSSALGLSDRVTTPISASTSGVLVHAASLSALLDGDSAEQHTEKYGQWVAGAWLATSMVLWLALLSRLTPLFGVLLLGGFAIGWMLIVFIFIENYLPLLPVLAAYLILLLAGIPFEWWVSRRNSARILRTFAHYVAPSVLAELLRQPDEKPLEPRFRTVTVLIADMEDYTRITASLGLEETADLTRGFLDCLTRPVLATGGTLDKYTGDGLVAFWNAPLPCADHADRAIEAANAICLAVDALNQYRISFQQEPVRVRIGIESGPALLGDLGTSFRSTYTAVGNCINFASKLQEAARDLPVNIVIGPGTRELVQYAVLHPLGSCRVRNLDHPIELFTTPPLRR